VLQFDSASEAKDGGAPRVGAWMRLLAERNPDAVPQVRGVLSSYNGKLFFTLQKLGGQNENN